MITKSLFLVFITLEAAFAASDFIVDPDCVITQYSQVNAVTKNCRNIIVSNLTVPGNATLQFNLQNGTVLEFQGRTAFEYAEWKGPLLKMKGSDVVVRGAKGHVLDGQGELYWDGLGGKGIKKPKFLRLQLINSIIHNINVKNCPVHCVSIGDTNNLTISEWLIDNREGNKNNFTGHNTDGFDVSANNVIIRNSVVHNQDDCVVVNKGSNVLVSNVSCHGGHGLSISAGFSDTDFEANSVYNVTFENSLVDRSPNGIHVKTHSDSGPGVVSNITYRNVRLENITNFGINIQQDYADGEATGVPGTNIPIVGLVLEGISGYMESYNNSPTLSNYILCGEGACTDWQFANIHIKGAQNESFCNFTPEGYAC